MKRLLLSFTIAALPALSQQTHWVTTWASAQLKATPPPANGQAKQPPTPAQLALAGFHDQTVRMVVPTTVAGAQARIEISNVFGDKPLTIGAASVALRQKDSTIQPGTSRELTVNGKKTFLVSAGASVITDPVALAVPQLSDLLVSLYFPTDTGAPTLHQVGLHTTYIAKGDATGQPELTDAANSASWYFLSAVHVLAPANTAAVVTFGDSITDGVASTPNENRSWPAIFAKRLAGNGAARVAVVNEGISGNRVLRDGAGANALARFDRDVLGVSGVKWVVVMEGINDIGRAVGNNANPGDAATADDIIAGHKQLIERAHMHGLKAIGATLTPYGGAGYYSEAGEAMRQAVNQFIRSGGAYDAVVDFDAVIRDPANPTRMQPQFNPGDNLHPNDAGYKAMAEAVNLALFQ